VNVEVGDVIPPWTLERVTPERMRTVAAILRDPNPIHWDPAASAKLGLGDRVVNQSPINVGYVVNMLTQWAGDSCVRRLRVEFSVPVFGEDSVTAGGVVTAITSDCGTRVAECEVWLDRQDGSRAIHGFAIVALPT
jgi:acyl dehydratase